MSLDLHTDTQSAIEALLVQQASHVVACNETEQDDLLAAFGADVDERLHLLPMGVDTQAFYPGYKKQARRELGLPEDAFIVLWGQLLTKPSPSSAMPAFLKAMNGFPAHMAFVQVSEEPNLMLPDMRERAAQGVGLINLAEGAKSVERLRACYAAADVMVAPPGYSAADCLNPREAMACGTPVVVFADMPNDEVASMVTNDVTGYVLKQLSWRDMVARLHDLRDQSQKRSAMSMAAVLRARTFFTWDRMANRLLRVYGHANAIHDAAKPVCKTLTLVPKAQRPHSGILVPAGL